MLIFASSSARALLPPKQETMWLSPAGASEAAVVYNDIKPNFCGCATRAGWGAKHPRKAVDPSVDDPVPDTIADVVSEAAWKSMLVDLAAFREEKACTERISSLFCGPCSALAGYMCSEWTEGCGGPCGELFPEGRVMRLQSAFIEHHGAKLGIGVELHFSRWSPSPSLDCWHCTSLANACFCCAGCCDGWCCERPSVEYLIVQKKSARADCLE